MILPDFPPMPQFNLPEYLRQQIAQLRSDIADFVLANHRRVDVEITSAWAARHETLNDLLKACSPPIAEQRPASPDCQNPHPISSPPKS